MVNLKWFPMRVTYHRELKVKEQLDILGIENYAGSHHSSEDDQERMRAFTVYDEACVK